jgi:hypothetical protein
MSVRRVTADGEDEHTQRAVGRKSRRALDLFFPKTLPRRI